MIAAQLYTVRDRLHDPTQLAGGLGRLRDIGYAGVEVAGLGAAVVEHFGRELQRAGLVACAAHESLDRLTEDLPAAAARCPARIAGELAPYSLGLAYHNHSFELERWGGKTGLEILFDTAPAAALFAELDTYWLQASGASPAAWLRRLAGRAPLVHLKDMAVRGGRIVQAEVGQGNLDWVEILKACSEAGTEWLVVEQDECAGDPLDSLAVSHRNLSSYLAVST